ncbi:MAG: hypothetical protein LIP18_05825 [Planctomycetes bacterium]|nr:hypothetical protein [Planctomycetota bacterium]
MIIAGYIIGWQFESSSQAHPAETTTITNTITNDSTNKNDSTNTNTNVTNITITLPQGIPADAVTVPNRSAGQTPPVQPATSPRKHSATNAQTTSRTAAPASVGQVGLPIAVKLDDGRYLTIEAISDNEFYFDAPPGESYVLYLFSPGGDTTKYTVAIDGLNIISKMSMENPRSARRGIITDKTRNPIEGWYMMDGTVERFRFYDAKEQGTAGVDTGTIRVTAYRPNEASLALVRGVGTEGVNEGDTHFVRDTYIEPDEEILRSFLVRYGRTGTPVEAR